MRGDCAVAAGAAAKEMQPSLGEAEAAGAARVLRQEVVHLEGVPHLITITQTTTPLPAAGSPYAPSSALLKTEADLGQL